MRKKAFEVTANDHDMTNLVFAINPVEARLETLGSDGFEDIPYIELRARRAYYADEHESSDERTLLHLMIRNGWRYEVEGELVDEDNLDDMIARGII